MARPCLPARQLAVYTDLNQFDHLSVLKAGTRDDLAAQMRMAEEETLPRSLGLCVLASTYIAIDVPDRRPTDADLHELAKRAARPTTKPDITEQETCNYLSRTASGPEKLDDAFPEEAIAPISLYATANLLLTLSPGEKHWWEYLDQIWDAAETADSTPLTVLPPPAPRPQTTHQLNPTAVRRLSVKHGIPR